MKDDLYQTRKKYERMESRLALPEHRSGEVSDLFYDPKHFYYLTLGSVFDFDMNSTTLDELATDILDTVNDTSVGNWHWYSDTTHIFHSNDKPSGRDLKDIHFRLYLSFDLPSDAMLLKMTLQDLKDIRHADSRGLPRIAE